MSIHQDKCVAIMQPYFFPYIGYFDLINYCDEFIVFDTPQYVNRGWMNRNRILHPAAGDMYVTVPLKKHSRNASISEVLIADNVKWNRKIIGQLNHYKRSAPFYEQIISLVRECIFTRFMNLSSLNVFCLERICAYIGVDFRYQLFSDMDLGISGVGSPGDWALEICKRIGANEYVNLCGGREIFSEKAFREAKIRLTFRKMNSLSYKQRRQVFVPNLSIIDVLMFVEPSEVRGYLDSLL